MVEVTVDVDVDEMIEAIEGYGDYFVFRSEDEISEHVITEFDTTQFRNLLTDIVRDEESRELLLEVMADNGIKTSRNPVNEVSEALDILHRNKVPFEVILKEYLRNVAMLNEVKY
jgi:hypothetical protein